MEELFNAINLPEQWEKRKSEIESRINELFSNSPDREVLTPLVKEIAQEHLWSTFSYEQKQKILHTEEKIKEYSVFLNTLTEFRYALEVVNRLEKYEENMIDRFLSHENAHMNIAEKYGLKGIGYSITPYKNPSGFKGFWAMTWTEKTPSNWTDEKIKEVYTKINEAPIIYDENGRLSELDSDSIDDLTF